LEDLLSSWGLEEREGYVVDAQCERIQMQSRYGQFTAVSVVDYPYMPICKHLSQDNPATRSLDAVTFPFAHPLVFKPVPGGAARYAALADSSRLSWYQSSAYVPPSE